MHLKDDKLQEISGHTAGVTCGAQYKMAHRIAATSQCNIHCLLSSE
jgi:desulfoferrodoxin (superoxide reductase-like protein)